MHKDIVYHLSLSCKHLHPEAHMSQSFMFISVNLRPIPLVGLRRSFAG